MLLLEYLSENLIARYSVVPRRGGVSGIRCAEKPRTVNGKETTMLTGFWFDRNGRFDDLELRALIYTVIFALRNTLDVEVLKPDALREEIELAYRAALERMT